MILLFFSLVEAKAALRVLSKTKNKQTKKDKKKKEERWCFVYISWGFCPMTLMSKLLQPSKRNVKSECGKKGTLDRSTNDSSIISALFEYNVEVPYMYKQLHFTSAF